MTDRLLICTDLDRTLLPNGIQPESPGARERFARVVAHPEVSLAYVTGRHRQLVLEAIERYGVPVPDYVIGDVGTTIYSLRDGVWTPWESWALEIGADWAGLEARELEGLFLDLHALRLQEPAKQSRYKLSYYAAADAETGPLLQEMGERLRRQGVRATLVWSVDETLPTGLLDVLPSRATKLHAIEFLMAKTGHSPARTLFAGDSGNDLPVLASPIPSVLVANATEDVRRQALHLAAERGTENALYLARGDFFGMNGNYSAGILEGLLHFVPRTNDWVAP